LSFFDSRVFFFFFFVILFAETHTRTHTRTHTTHAAQPDLLANDENVDLNSLSISSFGMSSLALSGAGGFVTPERPRRAASRGSEAGSLDLDTLLDSGGRLRGGLGGAAGGAPRSAAEGLRAAAVLRRPHPCSPAARRGRGEEAMPQGVEVFAWQ
jgi:hypothetical protein